MTSRGWCFTLHAKDAAEADLFCLEDAPLGGLPDGARYFIYETELGGDTQSVHIQGYIYFMNSVRMPKKLFGARAHWEKQRGTFDEAAAYCDYEAYARLHGENKDGDVLAGPWEFGERLHQGVSSDMSVALDMVLSGRPLREVAAAVPRQWVFHHRGFESLRSQILPVAPEWRTITVTWYWGATGVGKTRRCHAEAPGLYCVRGHGEWWDGYECQDAILFDEFYGAIRIAHMLRWLDGYRVALPVKGGFTEARWTRVFITSNADPLVLYGSVPADVRAAFFRRVNSIVQM